MKPDFRAGIIESLKLGHPIPQEYKPMVDEVKNGFNKWLNSPSKVKGKTRKVLFEEQVKANGETLDSPGVRLKLLEGFQADEIAKQTQKEK
jgi:hypothetical protein